MKRALIDLSSVIWTCLRAGKDVEHGRKVVSSEGKEVLVNSAGYGYENCINHLTTVMEELKLQPYQMIFVKEGMNSKANRLALHPGYKASRDKVPEHYEEFNKCLDELMGVFLGLGSSMVWQDGGVEADDVIGYLARALKGETWIVSGDKDLAACIGGNVHHYRRGEVDKNPFGPFDVKWIPTYIALVGDTSDKIPGAKGFGEKAAEKLLIMYGDDGLELMTDLIVNNKLGRLAEDVGDLKELQKIIDDQDNVRMSYQLARLRIESVNTLRNPLQWKVGMCKPREQCADFTMKKWGGQSKLVSAENYQEAYDFLQRQVKYSPFFSLDIETSTPPESDEWLELQDKEDKVVDVMGSELAGLSITFGPNLQYTYYITHDHVEEPGVTNCTLEQVRKLVELLPREKVRWVHSAAFELPVLYNEWGEEWKDDPDYHGFLPNVRDTLIASSYVDENESRGLKSLSGRLLGYDQTTYEEVTTKEHLVSEWNGVGRELGRWRVPVHTGQFQPDTETTDPDSGEITVVKGAEIVDYENGPEMVRVQYKMNQLRAREVTDYGCDDTIVTIALAVHFLAVMEIEDTVEAFEEVETWPAYLTALAFVQGADFSLEEMFAMEKEDDETYEKNWAILRDYLIRMGFDGTVCPVFEKLDAAAVKAAHEIVLGQPLKTQVRTPSKLGKLIQQAVVDNEYPEEVVDKASVLAMLVSNENLAEINAMVARNFKGEPNLDLASPPQMRKFLYDVVKIPVQIVNDATKIEREKEPLLDEALKKFKKKRMGKPVILTDADMALLRRKAKTDDTAVDYALAFDADQIQPEAQKALKSMAAMKKVMTRRSLFYKNYRYVRHWKTGKIHASVRQCAAVTRRYSMSNPNLQQLPKKGEGVRFRGCFKPHRKDAVIGSIDFTGQELRLAAERSQDQNMLACYIGENLKDIHSITAAGAMRLKWGDEKVDELTKLHAADLPHGMTKQEFEYRLFLKLRGLGKEDPVGKLADDLRKDSKNVNFAAQFGGQAAKLSETLIMRFEDAQLFLDARSAMFPDVDKAAKRAAEFAEKHGYALTLMKARRHLRAGIMSTDKREISAAQRQAWNMEIQGSAGEQIKLAMGRLWKSGVLFRLDARFLAVVHDELVSSVRKDHAAEYLQIKHDCMVAPYADMKVPVLGSISLGPDFAHQIECGDWFIKENVEKAVNDVFNKKEAA